MSERGSFVTEFIYCSKCFEAAKKILIRREKYLYSTTLKHHGTALAHFGSGDQLHIIAGLIGGLYAGEELHDFADLGGQLEKVICHPMRVAVLAEVGERIFTILPLCKDEIKEGDDCPELNCTGTLELPPYATCMNQPICTKCGWTEEKCTGIQ